MNHMIPAKAVELVKKWEGFRKNAYKDQAGIWTVGYGTTEGVKSGTKVTKEEAEELLVQHMTGDMLFLSKWVAVALNENQLSALLSFIYNIGRSAFQTSTLLKLLNRGHYDAVPEQLARWKYVTVGKEKIVSQGLVNRREDEARMWRGEL